MIAKRCYISGHVQGVFYRATARDKALALGVRGHARNLPDGRVEVLMLGEEPAVTELTQWLWVGSATSQVRGVEAHDIELDSLGQLPAGFASR